MLARCVNPGVPAQTAHASRGKAARAEPVVMLYKQGRVTHASGAALGALEDELVGWVPGSGASPGRLDELVWAVTTLGVHGGGEAGVEVFQALCGTSVDSTDRDVGHIGPGIWGGASRRDSGVRDPVRTVRREPKP